MTVALAAGGLLVPEAMQANFKICLGEACAAAEAVMAGGEPPPRISWEECQAQEVAARAKAAAAALPDLAPDVAADIVEAIHEEIEAADGEGLGYPYDEAAISTAVYIVKRLGKLPGDR